jgi:hypothetical protein
MKSNSTFSEYYTDKVAEYFQKLEEKARTGFYEELSDVNLFKKLALIKMG